MIFLEAPEPTGEDQREFRTNENPYFKKVIVNKKSYKTIPQSPSLSSRKFLQALG